jgi:hypothetical protein
VESVNAVYSMPRAGDAKSGGPEPYVDQACRYVVIVAAGSGLVGERPLLDFEDELRCSR